MSDQGMHDQADDDDVLDLNGPPIYRSLPADSPKAVAIAVLKFCQTTIRDLVKKVSARRTTYDVELRTRLKQLEGKTAFVVDLLEGKQGILEHHYDPVEGQ